MTAHELMIKTNHDLIQGVTLTDTQKQQITNHLLTAKTTREQANRFYNGVKFPGNTDSSGRRMYPVFFIPPYNNGKKMKTILFQTPKTQIFSANMYELEILRLLNIFQADRTDIREMTEQTLERLKTTCFAHEDDGVGECFDTSLVALRFLAVTAPGDEKWIQSRIDTFNRHYAEKKRPYFPIWYYWLCLSELPLPMVKSEVDKYKEEMLNWLRNKSCVMNSEHDKIIHPVLFSILRNNLMRYPEYEYIKDRRPYVSEKDGRLHFDL